MSDVLSKLSSYDLFNNLFPGVIFAALSGKVTSYSFLQQDIVIGLFVYYFIGLIISRFGSLVIEPILKKIKFVKFEPHEDYLSACKKDKKIDLLSEKNNSYRTLCSMFALLLLLKVYDWFAGFYPILSKYAIVILIFVLFIVFLCAYKKQTEFVVQRIKANR
jgi:hypothetical protein